MNEVSSRTTNMKMSDVCIKNLPKKLSINQALKNKHSYSLRQKEKSILYSVTLLFSIKREKTFTVR